jgi:hypothetical protein
VIHADGPRITKNSGKYHENPGAETFAFSTFRMSLEMCGGPGGNVTSQFFNLLRKKMWIDLI